MTNPGAPSIRYVVFHAPGPQWEYGVDFRERQGVREHVQHDLIFHELGKLELGGPFLLQDAGGIMVATIVPGGARGVRGGRSGCALRLVDRRNPPVVDSHGASIT